MKEMKLFCGRITAENEDYAGENMNISEFDMIVENSTITKE